MHVAKPCIALLTDRLETARQWRQWLESSAEIVDAWPSGNALPADVIVFDDSIDPARLPMDTLDEVPHARPTRPKRLAIGTEAARADWALPADVTQRELQLACGLLWELAKVERQRDELAQGQRALLSLAETDPLTNLANRRVWDEQLRQRSAGVAPDQLPWLAMIDLDHFKQVNERLGFAAADAVLSRVANALASQLRPGDLLARLGGDEFGVLLPAMSEAQARAVFERLRAAVSTGDAAAEPSVSIGFARVGQGDAASAMAAAEQSLRVAKNAGGNRVMGP